MALSHYHVIERPSGKTEAVSKILGTYGTKHGRPGWGSRQSAGRIAKIYARKLGDTMPSRIGPGYFMIGKQEGTVVIQSRACYDRDICRAASENISGICPGCGQSTVLRDGTILAANDGYCSHACREQTEA